MRKTNLCADTTSFVGRELDLERLQELLAGDARLVTILGPAGMGKTRLARRYGELRVDEGSRLASTGGVWFCELAEARSRDDIVAAVATVLGVPLARGPTADHAIVQVGHAIAARGDVLLLLDNFEQIAPLGPATVGEWLRRAPDAQFVVTSREPLGIDGEVLYRLLPLEEAQGLSLFEARAHAVRHGFVLSQENRDTARAIVRALDAMPLAIELAAARSGVLSPAKLQERLSKRFDLLGTARRDASPRHATLRNAIDWSWDLLSPWERDALTQCALFRGGFSLEAAEEVMDLGEHEEAPPVLDAVQALCEKSLVRTYQVPDLESEIRFGMYESIREYSMERLQQTPARDAAERRHAACYLRLGEEWTRETQGPTAPEALKLLILERDNLSAVQQRNRESDPATSARAALALEFPLRLRGPFNVHMELLNAAAEASHAVDDPTLRARVLRARGNARRLHGSHADANDDLMEALSAARNAGDPALEGNVLLILGLLRWQQERVAEALEMYEQALQCHLAVGNRRMEGLTRVHMANLAIEQGRFEEARSGCEAALTVLREAGDRRAMATALNSLGSIAQELDALDEAHQWFDQSLAAMQAYGDQRGEGTVLANLAHLHVERGDLVLAQARFEESVTAFREIGYRPLEGVMTGDLGVVHSLAGRPEEARACYQRALDTLREVGSEFREGIVLGYVGALEASRDRIEAAEQAFAQARGLLESSGRYGGLESLDVLEGILELARARAASDATSAQTHRNGGRSRWERADSGTLPDSKPLSESSSLLRLALRLLRHALDSDVTPPDFVEVGEIGVGATTGSPPVDALDIGPDCTWFRPPGGNRVELGRRRVLRRLLGALVRHRRDAPAEAISRDALVAATWPGERILPDSAANRLYGAVSTLRELGLREILLNRTDGYLLAVTVPIRIAG